MANTLLIRPRLLTWICVLGYIASLFSLIYAFSPHYKRINDFLPAVWGTLVTLRFISYVGVWHMKRWGVQLNLMTFFGKILFFLAISEELGVLSYVSLVFSFFYLIAFMVYYKRMDDNL